MIWGKKPIIYDYKSKSIEYIASFLFFFFLFLNVKPIQSCHKKNIYIYILYSVILYYIFSCDCFEGISNI